MSNLKPLDIEGASGRTKELLDFVKARSGRVPNMVALLANSPTALGAYLDFATAMREAELASDVQSLIAVAVANECGCAYTLSAVTAMARRSGTPESELDRATKATSADARKSAAMQFAIALVRSKGAVGAGQLSQLRAQNYSEPEIAEICAVVALNLFRCHFNRMALPEADFPPVALKAVAE